MKLFSGSLPLCAVFLCLALTVTSVSGQEDSVESTAHLTLDNGFEVFLLERHNLPLVHIVLGFDVGSKNETQETSGLVHILEHYILFRGTHSRTGEEISQDIREHGGYYNAYTGRDFSLFELTLPSEHLDFGLENQKDILFNLKLTQEDLDEEKEVILEEIRQIKDDPLRYGLALVYENLFPDHPYSRPIYGDPAVIQSVPVEGLLEFYESYFVPANGAMAVVGDFDAAELEQKIRDIFGELPQKDPPSQEISRIPELDKTVEIEEEMDINRGYVFVGMTGPDYNAPDQYAMDVLVEIVGAGVSPLLHSHLNSRRVPMSSVAAFYTAHRYGGTVLASIALEPGKINTAKRESVRFFKNSRSLSYSKNDYLGESQYYALDYLQSAKNQIKFRVYQAQERGLVLANSLVRYMLIGAKPDKGSYLDHLEGVDSSAARKAAGDYFSRGRYVIVSLKPKKDK